MKNMVLGKYSMGVGDRFSNQAAAQLSAIIQAKANGVEITPVWNKSYREHSIIKSKAVTTAESVHKAVKKLNWQGDYFLDADHINLTNVDFFIDCCSFFTLDVADYINDKYHLNPDNDKVKSFVERHMMYVGDFGLGESSYTLSSEQISSIACKYLTAIEEAGKIYRHIESKLGKGNFVTEVSMDETDSVQTPIEIFFILAAVSEQGIPAQTIAPRFSGRFNKGVEYVGDPEKFAKEFEEDTLVIKKAVKEFGLPENLKLSIHSGSDKFSIYPKICDVMKKYDSGVHLKTAGTTWLEEIIGLAAAGGTGLEIAKKIYEKALDRFDELCAPYASVIDIDKTNLPSPEEVVDWDGKRFAASVRHDQSCKFYNSDIRQLLHVGYKIAVEMDDKFYSALQDNRTIIAANVKENIYTRHIKSLFGI